MGAGRSLRLPRALRGQPAVMPLNDLPASGQSAAGLSEQEVLSRVDFGRLTPFALGRWPFSPAFLLEPERWPLLGLPAAGL